MLVQELIELLKTADPDAEVLIADNGSILNTGSVQESVDYNNEVDFTEFYIVTEEW